MKNYIPEAGDIIWLDLDPTLGKEQAGKRPVLVITSKLYNQYGLCISVPIRSKIKGFNTEVILENTKKVKGAVLTNHIRTHDWTTRNATFIEKISKDRFTEVKLRIRALLEL